MTRVLLVLLAVLAAGIGFAVQFRWLYAGASVLLLVALGLWVRDVLKERRRAERRTARVETTEEGDDLRSLGIMEIRPRQRETPTEKAAGEETPGAEAAAVERPEAETADTPPQAPAPGAEPAPDEPVPDEEQPPPQKAPPDEPDEEAEPAADAGPQELAVNLEERPAPQWSQEEPREEPSAETTASRAANQEALGALVRAVRLSVGAQVACLLAQEELALNYRIEALDAASEAPPLRKRGTTFSTEAALLSASAARQPVTHVAVGREEGLAPRLLGYYQHPGDLQDTARPPEAAALVPVPLPDAPTTHFLLLDGQRNALGGKDALLKRFAALFAQLLVSPDDDAPPASAPPASAPPPASLAGETPSSENGQAGPARREEPRPRREIIAEEMEQARAEGRELALAFVYLNRAEAVAERGETEVHAAERALRARLRQAVPEGRVERFGELTYGVFLTRGRAEAEAWAVALQDELDRASDPLEGGVSVGLALMRGPEQSPAALRENATNALHEAYTTGTCTVLE